ncbi:MAG: DUF3365 domain-containing protein [Phycisphaerae bacterium]|nr:DUF3365 domain-containing protein [Phycisphaerae bacterium]
MANKWYKISISLAAKCRIGFAAAVLLITVAGLFLPYRWMDKLVEQGMLDLAKSQVDYVLQRHCQTSTGPGTSDKPSLVNPQDDTDNPKPITNWYRITGQAENFNHEDRFIQRNIRRLAKDKKIPYIFDFRVKQQIVEDESLLPDIENEEKVEGFGKILPSNEPSRYLYPVRANISCMKCHASTPATAVDIATETENSVTKKASEFTEGQLVGVISVDLPAGQSSVTLLFNRIFIIIGGTISCVMAVVVFYIITQRVILSPVRRLRMAAEAIVPIESAANIQKENGKPESSDPWLNAMDITSKIKTGDEFEHLATAFHQMLSRLKIAHDRLQETNRALDIRLGELEAKNIALYESNKLKSEFLANVSHELRTPLNAILGFADILKDSAVQREDDRSIRYASNVVESGTMLLGIINDLLDLVKIEAGKIEMHWQRMIFDELIKSLINLNRPQADEKALELILIVDENIGEVETDVGKLQQIIFNLISNAVKFTPDSGRVEIKARIIKENYTTEKDFPEPIDIPPYSEPYWSLLQIRVIDTGPGIPEDKRDVIFEKFQQLDSSVTREHAGIGLGLSIVKELLNIMGGSITVGGEVGTGSVFTIMLPIRKYRPIDNSDEQK